MQLQESIISSLDQTKLDVTDKRETNLFDWKGQFTPDFIKYLLDIFSKDGMTVTDPFAGSGTVLYEALSRNLDCIGFEINPSAYYMAKFYEYAKCNIIERNTIISKCEQIIRATLDLYDDDTMIYIKDENDDYRMAFRHLLDFSSQLAKNRDEALLPFFINILFLCEKDKKYKLKESVRKNFDKIKSKLIFLPFTNASVSAYIMDSREFSKKYTENVDLIITSPPYVNVFNYHQNYRGIIECFNFDILNVAKSEIGANRKHRSNRLKTVVQYALDMGKAVYNSALSLKIGGRMIYVVGVESTVLRTSFNNSQIIQDVVSVIPELSIEGIRSRSFVNRYGETIKEDIIVIKKCKKIINPPSDDVFFSIGLNHLRLALSYADETAKGFINRILSGEEKVQASPILSNIYATNTTQKQNS